LSLFNVDCGLDDAAPLERQKPRRTTGSSCSWFETLSSVHRFPQREFQFSFPFWGWPLANHRRASFARAEIRGEHLVFLNSDGTLAALFPMEIVESWNGRSPRVRCWPGVADAVFWTRSTSKCLKRTPGGPLASSATDLSRSSTPGISFPAPILSSVLPQSLLVLPRSSSGAWRQVIRASVGLYGQSKVPLLSPGG
jgi:hypothetical protein